MRRVRTRGSLPASAACDRGVRVPGAGAVMATRGCCAVGPFPVGVTWDRGVGVLIGSFILGI